MFWTGKQPQKSKYTYTAPSKCIQCNISNNTQQQKLTKQNTYGCAAPKEKQIILHKFCIAGILEMNSKQ